VTAEDTADGGSGKGVRGWSRLGGSVTAGDTAGGGSGKSVRGWSRTGEQADF